MTAFVRFAVVSGAADTEATATAARALVGDAARGSSALEAARRVKRHLARAGWRDDANTIGLPAMLATRRGNCLGLTLLVGAALLEADHDVRFALRVHPLDDVHTAEEEHFARLQDPDEGVHEDSRLPEARDRSARFRFVPVEHASLVLPPDDTPFEATSLANPLDVDPSWAPAAESIRRVLFEELVTTVWSERGKLLLHVASDLRDVRVLRRSLALALWAVRAWPENREAWADVWRVARALGEHAPSAQARMTRLAEIAAERYRNIGGADSLFQMTRYRMTGAIEHLDAALVRYPSHVEAYFERHVAQALENGGAIAEARRAAVLACWMAAESGILDLERFYRERAVAIEAAFSADELREVLASFAEPPPPGVHSRPSA